MAIGKNTISLRRKDTTTQRSPSTNFQKVIFAHKAAGGEASLNLLALTDPGITGFVQPSNGTIADLNLYLNRKNLTITSTLRGVLMDYVSYRVDSSAAVSFIDFTLEANEVLYFTVDPVPRSGILAVNGDASPSTGSLAVGDTLFACPPFEYNKYPSQQAGAILVYRNGLLQARCDANNIANDGNYIEVAPGSGTISSQIQFKNAPVGTADAIMVVPNGMLVEKPAGSQLAAIESLAAQVDAMATVVADGLLDGDKSPLQANPSNVDLRNFGDQVIDHEKRIAALETPNLQTRALFRQSNSSAIWYNWSTPATPYITLTPGIYWLDATTSVIRQSGSNLFTRIRSRWFASAGGDSGSTPTQLDAGGNITILAGPQSSQDSAEIVFDTSKEFGSWITPNGRMLVRVNVTTNVYFNVQTVHSGGTYNIEANVSALKWEGN
jgi:hypothetical protein